MVWELKRRAFPMSTSRRLKSGRFPTRSRFTADLSPRDPTLVLRGRQAAADGKARVLLRTPRAAFSSVRIRLCTLSQVLGATKSPVDPPGGRSRPFPSSAGDRLWWIRFRARARRLDPAHRGDPDLLIGLSRSQRLGCPDHWGCGRAKRVRVTQKPCWRGARAAESDSLLILLQCAYRAC
jgi:hypothetical protein